MFQIPTAGSTRRLALVDFCFLSDGDSNWNQMTSCIGSIYISLIAKDIEYFFIFIDDLYFIFGELYVHFIIPFINWFVCYFAACVLEFFMYSAH